MPKAFKSVIEYKIPNLGVYYVSEGPFMTGDSDLFRCWKNGGCINAGFIDLDKAKQWLQAAIKEDIQRHVIETLNKLTEMNQILVLTEQADWLADFIKEDS